MLIKKKIPDRSVVLHRIPLVPSNALVFVCLCHVVPLCLHILHESLLKRGMEAPLVAPQENYLREYHCAQQQTH